MPARIVRFAAPASPELAARFQAARARLGIPEEFPADVLDEAQARARSPRLPARDLTAMPFVTLDPPGAMDLDQAFHLERRTGGFRVRYAIADVAAFVDPGRALDTECHRRVLTSYSPDGRAPLHPPVLAEQAASLLPDGPRPAVVWTLDLDREGELTSIRVERAMVASRAKLDYPSLQATVDAGQAEPTLELLREIGTALAAAERGRGGMSLHVPAQEVVAEHGTYRLVHRAPLPCEQWNAQLSLLTGRAAARMMLDGGVGVLRTMPAADPRDVRRLRDVARGLGIDWPDDLSYANLLDRLDARRSPAEAAFLEEAAVLFRGAGYHAFDGAEPELATHAAIAAPYAHCTAPLRRLVDRYASEICLAHAAGRAVPEWVRVALARLPEEMADAGRRAGQLERANLDIVEAAVLAHLVGQPWSAIVIDRWEGDRGEIVIAEPAVTAPCDGRFALGEVITAVLAEADVESGTVRFVRRVEPPTASPSA